MAIEKRKALVHIVFTFDCDTVGPERLKRAGVAAYAVGMWDSQRPDPRPRDGVNAPIDLPPQTGFWAEGAQPQLTHEELTLGDGDGLPVDLADMLNAAALRKVGDQEALITGMREEGRALIEQLLARDKTVQEQAATIAGLQLASRDERAATLEERVTVLEAARAKPT